MTTQILVAALQAFSEEDEDGITIWAILDPPNSRVHFVVLEPTRLVPIGSTPLDTHAGELWMIGGSTGITPVPFTESHYHRLGPEERAWIAEAASAHLRAQRPGYEPHLMDRP